MDLYFNPPVICAEPIQWGIELRKVCSEEYKVTNSKPVQAFGYIVDAKKTTRSQATGDYDVLWHIQYDQWHVANPLCFLLVKEHKSHMPFSGIDNKN